MTIPCYCLGIAALASVPAVQLPDPTPFELTATPTSTPLFPDQPTPTGTTAPAESTPTATLDPTPTQLFPTVPATQSPTSEPATATPTNTASPTTTPTGTVPPTDTPTPTATPNATATAQAANATATAQAANATATAQSANRPPIANDDQAATIENNQIIINVLANDSDDNLDPATVTLTNLPANGVAKVNQSSGQISYAPNQGFSGADAFSYQVCDTAAACDTATVAITVTAANQAPLANADSASTPQDASIIIDVLANDSDPDGNLDPSTVTVSNSPANGAAQINQATGHITYTPNQGFSGSDAFSYQVCDTAGDCATATVTVTVTTTNQAPLANDDSAATAQDNQVTIDVLANDSDSDGNLDPASLTISNGPANGAAQVNQATGHITYIPLPDFNGSDSFSYQVCDTAGACDTAMVAITVTAANQAPQANDDNANTAQDISIIIDVLANDSDPDNNLDPASLTLSQNPTNGDVEVDLTAGHITYTPLPGFNGSDSFSYQVCDTAAACDTATVAITVNPN